MDVTKIIFSSDRSVSESGLYSPRVGFAHEQSEGPKGRKTARGYTSVWEEKKKIQGDILFTM